MKDVVLFRPEMLSWLVMLVLLLYNNYGFSVVNYSVEECVDAFVCMCLLCKIALVKSPVNCGAFIFSKQNSLIMSESMICFTSNAPFLGHHT